MKKSLLRYCRNTILNEYIWAGNNKTPIKKYRNVFIKMIISSEKNEFSNSIIKIIRIPNIAFYPSFIYNIIIF